MEGDLLLAILLSKQLLVCHLMASVSGDKRLIFVNEGCGSVQEQLRTSRTTGAVQFSVGALVVVARVKVKRLVKVESVVEEVVLVGSVVIHGAASWWYLVRDWE